MGHHGEVQMNGSTLDLPINGGRQWNGLETLAEAARHSDLGVHHTQAEQDHGVNGTPEPGRSSEGLLVHEGYV